MKTYIFPAFCLAVLLAGCDAVSSRVHERFVPPPPHERVFPYVRKVVYEAAQQAVKDVGLQLGHKSLAEGRIEGYAAIRGGDGGTRDARQTSIQVLLFETDAGDTRVELQVIEQTEGDFPGGLSEQVLPQHGLYEHYFAALQQILSDGGAPKATAKP